VDWPLDPSPTTFPGLAKRGHPITFFFSPLFFFGASSGRTGPSPSGNPSTPLGRAPLFSSRSGHLRLAPFFPPPRVPADQPTPPSDDALLCSPRKAYPLPQRRLEYHCYFFDLRIYSGARTSTTYVSRGSFSFLRGDCEAFSQDRRVTRMFSFRRAEYEALVVVFVRLRFGGLAGRISKGSRLSPFPPAITVSPQPLCPSGRRSFSLELDSPERVSPNLVVIRPPFAQPEGV